MRLIVLLTLLFMSVILTTQLSFGRMFAFAWDAGVGGMAGGVQGPRVREWRENRRRDKQRQEVIAKHAGKKGVKPEDLEAERPMLQPKTREASRPKVTPGPAKVAAGPREREHARVVTPPAPPAPVRGEHVARAHRAQARGLHVTAAGAARCAAR